MNSNNGLSRSGWIVITIWAVMILNIIVCTTLYHYLQSHYRGMVIFSGVVTSIFALVFWGVESRNRNSD